jgi:hypothetical protein
LDGTEDAFWLDYVHTDTQAEWWKAYNNELHKRGSNAPADLHYKMETYSRPLRMNIHFNYKAKESTNAKVVSTVKLKADYIAGRKLVARQFLNDGNAHATILEASQAADREIGLPPNNLGDRGNRKRALDYTFDLGSVIKNSIENAENKYESQAPIPMNTAHVSPSLKAQHTTTGPDVSGLPETTQLKDSVYIYSKPMTIAYEIKTIWKKDKETHEDTTNPDDGKTELEKFSAEMKEKIRTAAIKNSKPNISEEMNTVDVYQKLIRLYIKEALPSTITRTPALQAFALNNGGSNLLSLPNANDILNATTSASNPNSTVWFSQMAADDDVQLRLGALKQILASVKISPEGEVDEKVAKTLALLRSKQAKPEIASSPSKIPAKESPATPSPLARK